MIYYLLFLGYCILAAVALPIPVEAGLLLSDGFWSMIALGIVMGTGKAIGSFVVFKLGLNFEDELRRWRAFEVLHINQVLRYVSDWCKKHGYLTMYFILALPLMTDTVPLYVFSMVNRDGEVFKMSWFVMTNFWAGFSRAMLVFILAAAGFINF